MKELYDSNTMQRIGIGQPDVDDDYKGAYHESCGHTHALNFDFTEQPTWIEELIVGDHECGYCGEYLDAIHAPQPDTFSPF